MNNEMDQLLLEVENLLSSEKTHGYGFFPLPCDIDKKINHLVQTYKIASESQRIEIRNFFTDKHSFGWICFSERMSVLAVREKKVEYLLNGLIAIAIEDFKFDSREDMVILPLHFNSALKIGANPKEIFEQAAIYASPRVASCLTSFGNDDPIMFDLKYTRYREVMTPEGFSYQRS